MILDAQNRFSDAQALTATAASTDEIDLSVDRDIGIGEPMGVVITVGVAADFTTTDETYQFDVRTDSAADMSVSPEVIASRVILATDLTAGSIHVLPLPNVNERYIDVNYTLGGTTPTVTVSAYLQPLSMIDGYRTYANSYSIT
jgi:hypothetical protein